MDFTYTVNNLPLFGGVVIVLVILLTSGGEFFSFLGGGVASLPQGGYRYYAGRDTVLYLYQQKGNGKVRAYILEGPPPDGFKLHRSRAGMYVVISAGSSAEAEMILERAYGR